MADVQKEHGKTEIANSLLEALARTRIPGEARQVLDFILRKTYGWHKVEDQISLDQFVLGTGLSKVHVCRAIEEVLLKINIITKKGNVTNIGNTNYPIYGIQKDFDKWTSLPKKVTLPKKVKVITNIGNIPITNIGNIQKKYIKEPKETTKERYVTFFEFFWKAYPSRNGKKLEKSETFDRYCQLKEDDFDLINRAVQNYAESEMVKNGIGIRDPKRFIRDGKGNEPWRDWIEPEKSAAQDDDWMKRWRDPNSAN